MSTSWSSPDSRRVVTGTAFGKPFERVEQVWPPVRQDVAAGLLTVVVTVLAGAPVGLLWAALAPRAAVVASGSDYLRADPSSDANIAADGYFLAAVLLAGFVTGLFAWWLGRAHGPAVVLGLAAGGLAAAFVAMQVGEQVGLVALHDAVRAGDVMFDLNLQLMAHQALAGWPVGALVAYLVPSLISGR